MLRGSRFFGAVGLFQDPSLACLVGNAAFREAGLSSRTSNLFVVCGCLLLVKIDFFQGLSPACLVGILNLCEVGIFSRASNLLLVCVASFAFCEDGFFSGPVTGLFVKRFLVELQFCLFAVFVFCEAGFVSGPVTGLLGRAAAFREALFLVELIGFLFW